MFSRDQQSYDLRNNEVRKDFNIDKGNLCIMNKKNNISPKLKSLQSQCSVYTLLLRYKT